MSDASTAVKNLRERLAGPGEERLGRALSDLLDNPLLTGAIGAAFDAREKAAQAQELAMGALNLPSAADIERLTRRLRSVSQRLEGIEDGVYRLDRALAGRGIDRAEIDERLTKIEEQLGTLSSKLVGASGQGAKPTSGQGAKPSSARSGKASPRAPKAAGPRSRSTPAAGNGEPARRKRPTRASSKD
jgi:hypothetical protein